MIKALAKEVLPVGLVQFIGRLRALSRQRYLSKLSTAHAFDEVYRRGMWKQGSSLSGPGSEGAWAAEFRRIVADFVRDKSVQSILDIGCGDFLVGAQLAPLVQSMIGMDVSVFIIEQNRTSYRSLLNVTFLSGDICESKLPKVDLVIIRQVLQHLTNAQIERALRNVESSGAKYVLVAEQIMSPDKMIAPNLDLSSHTVMTRVSMMSGVMVTQPPFSRSAQLLEMVEPNSSNMAEPGSVLAVSLLDFSG